MWNYKPELDGLKAKYRGEVLSELGESLRHLEQVGLPDDSHDFLAYTSGVIAPVVKIIDGDRRKLSDEARAEILSGLGLNKEAARTLLQRTSYRKGGKTFERQDHRYHSLRSVLFSETTPDEFKQAVVTRINEFYTRRTDFRFVHVKNQISQLDERVVNGEVKTAEAYVDELDQIVSPTGGSVAIRDSPFVTSITESPLLTSPTFIDAQGADERFEQGRRDYADTVRHLTTLGVPEGYAQAVANHPHLLDLFIASRKGRSPLEEYVLHSIIFANSRIHGPLAQRPEFKTVDDESIPTLDRVLDGKPRKRS